MKFHKLITSGSFAIFPVWSSVDICPDVFLFDQGKNTGSE